MNIRKANVNDAEKILNMLKQLDTETKFMLFEPGERTITVDEIKKRLDREYFKAVMVLVEDEDKIVGYLSADRGVFRRIRHSAYITVGLLKDYRGKKLGTKLFEEMERWARKNNVTRLDLTVLELNETAIGLYEKMGFKKEGLKERAMKIDGEYVNQYYMGKVLD